jgi:hypothetical protein
VKVVGLVAAVLAGCASAPEPPPRGPTLHLTLPSLDGGFIDFAELRGKTLVVHVFTTWAMPAAADAEHLRELARGRHDVAVVGVALDRGRANVVRAWRRATEVEYPIALADEAVRAGRSLLGPTGQVPITLLYDRRGRLARRWDGPLGETAIEEIGDLADTSRGLR